MYYFWNKRQNTVSWSCPPGALLRALHLPVAKTQKTHTHTHTHTQHTHVVCVRARVRFSCCMILIMRCFSPPEFLPFWGNELVGIPVGPNFADSDNAELPDTFEVLQVDSAQQPFAQETGVTITRFESTAGGAGRDLSAEEHHGRQSRGVDETSDVLERASAPALHMLRSSGAALNGSPSTVAPREARGEHEDCEGLDHVGVPAFFLLI